MSDKFYYKNTQIGRHDFYEFIIAFVLLSNEEAEKIRQIIQKCGIYTTHLGEKPFTQQEADRIIESLDDNDLGIYSRVDAHQYHDLLNVNISKLINESSRNYPRDHKVSPLWWSDWL